MANPNYQEPIALSFEDVGAGSDVEQPFLRNPRPIKILQCRVASAAAVTANATNYVTVALKNGSTTIASFDTSSTGLTAKTYRAMTVTAANIHVAAGSTLTIDFAHSGTGVAVSNPVVQIEYEAMPGANA